MKYPFSPEYLDAVPEELAELLRGLDEKLLEEICLRLNASGQLNEVTVQDIRALRARGYSIEEIQKAVSDASGVAEKELEQILDDVVIRNQAYYTQLATLTAITAPDDMLSFVSADDIDAIRRQTMGEFRNITRSMGYIVRQNGRAVRQLPAAQAYQWALDQAELQVASGAISYSEAIKGAVKELADSGLKIVRYENNGRTHYDHADVAARRAVMTGVNQLCQKYAEQSAERLNADTVEVSAHMGARNTGIGAANHASWQGRLYSRGKGKYPDFESTTGYGTGEGLGGWNCRHHWYPFVDGIMERTYTDKQLGAIDNPPFEYEGKTYDQYAATQKQREIERTVRKLRREQTAFEAAGLKEDAAAAKTRIQRLNAKYKSFSEAAGLPMQKDRMEVLDKKL